MDRGLHSLTLAAVLAAGCPAFADQVADQITRQLRDQGFDGVSVTRAWLGRTRITSTSGDGQREIIVNPQTGEILRDLCTTSAGSSGTNPAIGTTGFGNGKGTGNGGSHDADDDDSDSNSVSDDDS